MTHWSKNGFSPLAAKLLIGSKKVRGCKNDTHLLYHRAKYGWDSSSCAGCRRKKVWCFCLFFVTLWNDEVCGNGNAMKKCNFQNNYGVAAQRKVCSCAHIFNFFCGPRNFPLGANLYKKLPFFCDSFLAAHIFQATVVKFGMRVRTWESLHHAKFGKNHLMGIPFWANSYQKYQFLWFRGL